MRNVDFRSEKAALLHLRHYCEMTDRYDRVASKSLQVMGRANLDVARLASPCIIHVSH